MAQSIKGVHLYNVMYERKRIVLAPSVWLSSANPQGNTKSTVASEEEAESLHADEQKWINTYFGQQELDFDESKVGIFKKPDV